MTRKPKKGTATYNHGWWKRDPKFVGDKIWIDLYSLGKDSNEVALICVDEFSRYGVVDDIINFTSLISERRMLKK